MLECSMIKRKKIKHMKDYYSIFLHYSSTFFVYQELYSGSTGILNIHGILTSSPSNAFTDKCQKFCVSIE